jgi:adenylate kinase
MSDSSDSEGQAPHAERKIPNILVTGTPGTGKTTTSELIAEATGLTHVNVGDLVKQKQLHEGYLEEFDTHILDEDKVYSIDFIAVLGSFFLTLLFILFRMLP